MRATLLALSLVLIIIAATACGGEEDEAENTDELVITFDDEPLPPLATAAPQNATAVPTDLATKEEEEGAAGETGTDAISRVGTALSQLEFLIEDIDTRLDETVSHLQDLQEQQDTDEERIRHEIQTELAALTDNYIRELDQRINSEMELAIAIQDTEYEQLLRDIKYSFEQHQADYRQALESWPAPQVRFQPFVQTAVDRRQTELEWVLQPLQQPLGMASFGQGTVYNLDEEDKGKVVGLSRHEGDNQGRGVIPGFVPHLFPSEVYRSVQFVDVRFYDVNEDTETTLDNQYGQGFYYKPVLPNEYDCSRIKLFVTENMDGEWTPWEEGADGCDQDGVNYPGRYIVAVALNVQR